MQEKYVELPSLHHFSFFQSFKLDSKNPEAGPHNSETKVFLRVSLFYQWIGCLL
jgi:hypothetical protein